MTVAKLLAKTESILRENGCESPLFDATCLIEDIGGIGRGTVAFSKNVTLPQERINAVLKAAERRAEGYPLQYILGSWDFLNLTLRVGEGVLIPRPETELLCETAAKQAEKIWGSSPITVWDLCAGSGCVGLGIAALLSRSNVEICEFEISPKAFSYLQTNIKTYSRYNVHAVQTDILADFDSFDGPVHVLVSNPPYIPTKDLSCLQKEVQHEPSLALDGSHDGLRFYRTIAQKWIPKLESNGIAAVEVGVGQSKAVKQLFEEVGLIDIETIEDFAGIERVVVGIKP